MLINNAVITGSFTVNGVDAGGITGSAQVSSSFLAVSASYAITSGSYAQTSASLSIRTSNLEATSSTLVSASSSFAASSASISSRVNIVETSYATTGSNNFTGIQHITSTVNPLTFSTSASLYTDGGLLVSKDSFISGTAYFNNVVVYGTSSIQYITSSQINIGASYINLNTNLPAQRFGGMNVADSGSNAGVTGSLLWDSVNNGWIYSKESGSTYKGGALISGPRNTGSIGNEQTTTACYLMMGQGGDHITSSQVYHDSSTTCFYGTSFISASGFACFSNQICSTKLTTSPATNCTSYLDGSTLSFSRTSDNASDVVYLRRTNDLGTNGTANLNGYDGIIFRTTGPEAERARITACGYLAVTGNQSLACVPYLQGMSFGWNRSNGQGESMINWTNAGGGSACDLTFNFWNNTTLFERMRITSGGNVQIKFNPGSGNLYFSDVTNGADMLYLVPATYVGSAPYNSNRIIAANSSNIAFEAGGSERMRITSTGRVSINGATDDCAGTLWSCALSSTSNAGRFRGCSSNYSVLDVCNYYAGGIGLYAEAGRHYFGGCVGVGVSSPQTTLELNGGNSYFPAKILTLSGAENTRYNGFIGLNLIGGSQLAMSLGTRSNNVDYASTLNLYQGNVGINCSQPAYPLHVNGQIYSSTNVSAANSRILNQQSSNAWTDNTAHSVVGAIGETTGFIRLINNLDGSNTDIPFYASGGSGVAYRWTVLDPDTGWIINTAGWDFAFTTNGSQSRTFGLAASGGAGTVTICQPSGTANYCMKIFIYAQN